MGLGASEPDSGQLAGQFPGITLVSRGRTPRNDNDAETTNMNRPRVPIVLVLFAALMTRALIAHGQQQVINREPEIKAEARRQSWESPCSLGHRRRSGAGAPLKIGVLGADPFQQGDVNHLDKQLAGQNVVVQRFATVDKYQPCHILVVSQAADLQPALEKRAARRACHRPIARPGHTGRDGQLVVAENKVRMEVNPVAVRTQRDLNRHPALLVWRSLFNSRRRTKVRR